MTMSEQHKDPQDWQHEIKRSRKPTEFESEPQEPKIEVSREELIQKLETSLIEMEGLLEVGVDNSSVGALRVTIKEMRENLEELKSL
jgi:hypothetical protein